MAGVDMGELEVVELVDEAGETGSGGSSGGGGGDDGGLSPSCLRINSSRDGRVLSRGLPRPNIRSAESLEWFGFVSKQVKVAMANRRGF